MNSQSKRGIFIAIGVTILITVSIFIFFRNQQAGLGGEDSEAELTPDELFQVVELRNQGIAQLENHHWQKGSQTFLSLIEIIPESRLGYQNLSIGRTSLFLSLDPSTTEEELQQAKTDALETIKKLRELAPDSPISFRLEAKLLEKESQAEQAVELLKQAAEKSPEDPTIWYEISRVSQTSRDPATLAAGNVALDRLHELVPENVFAFMQWMNATLQENTDQLPEIVKELETLLTPLAPGIEKRNRYNVMTFLDAVKENIEQGNLDAAKNRLAPIKNIVTGDDVSRSDREQLDQDLLAFVDFAFAEPIQNQLSRLSKDVKVESIPVTFTVGIAASGLKGKIKSVQFADLTLDGQNEKLVLAEGTLEVFPKSTEENGRAKNVELDLDSQPHGFILADLDYDLKELPEKEGEEFAPQHSSDLDLICFGPSGIEFYRNDLEQVGGTASFAKVESNIGELELRNVTQVVPADLNNDGDLDLAVIADGHLHYLNSLGEFQFEKVSLPKETQTLRIKESVALDFDRDIDIDLLVLLENGSLILMESYRHGTFRWTPLDQQYSGKSASSMYVLDVDHNGSWDVVLAGSDGVEILLTQMPETGKVRFKSTNKITTRAVTELIPIDYNNDGRIDFAINGEAGLSFLKANDNLQFTEVDILEEEVKNASSLVAADYDSDGDIDLAGISNDGVAMLTNEGGNQNSWIDVALLAARVEDKGGSGSQRINHYGYGSLIEIRSGTNFQQAYVDSPVTRFGLGDKKKADAVRIIWTNGIPQNIVQPETNQKVWEVQKLLGSCPYLYTWNGEKFVFVTDLLWASPIGLQNAAKELVPARPWEYLKVSGEMLKPKDGKYQLQVTEELWEVAYFDKLELIAVDHPAEVDIYSNEKVGPPFIAEYKIHQVKNKQTPVSVKNHFGRDLLSEVEAEDEIYAKPFTERLTQGYTDDTYMEIDFGLKDKPESLKLFMTGWIYPTDTGLNVALSEDASRPGPAPPSISVPNASGEFVEVIPYCGFPGGKTKTIVLDLTDKFLTDDYRIRFSTSMELYWDQIFFSTESSGGQLVQQPLRCLSADLHYRGVSGIEHGRNNGPERFIYQDTITTPAWPTIEGNFTRFGDVNDLLSETDDRLLIIGTGDEVTLEFSLPEKPLPAGWKRDFILHCVGWDKDANLHTVTGQTVGPLPFVKMESYPYFEDQPNPEDYLQEFQTRQLNKNVFRSVIKQSTLNELDHTEPTQPN